MHDAILLVDARGYGLVTVRVPDCGARDGELEVRLTAGVEVVLDLGLGSRDTSVRLATADGAPLGELTATSTGLAVVELAPGEYVARRRTEGVDTHFRVEAEPLQVSMD